MAFSNSNLVHFFNTVNLSKTKDLTKINAEASILTGKLVAEVLRENYKQNDLLNKNLFVAIKNNQALEDINLQLNEIGKGLNVLNSGIFELTDAVREQTKIHKEHYDEIKKEKILKEILYNMKKYFSSLQEINDPIAKAYAAKTLIKMLDNGNLKTKDLSEIKDKEFYDEQLTDGKNILLALTQDENKQLEEFETLYSSYDPFSNVKIEKEFASPKKLIPIKKINYLNPENKKPIKPKDIENIQENDLHEIEQKIINKEKRNKLLNILLIGLTLFFIIFIISVVAAINIPESDQKKIVPLIEQHAVLVRLFTFIFLSLILLIPVVLGIKYFLSMKVMDKSRFAYIKNLYHEFVEKTKSHEKYLSEYEIQIQKENEKIEKENLEIMNFNKELELNIEKAKENQKNFLSQLRTDLNSFLDKHSKIQNFLPKV